MPLPPLTAWQALGLRLTTFREPGAATQQPTRWWPDVVGSPPDKIMSQPRLGLHQEEGPYGGGTLSLQVLADRIDWVLTGSAEEEAQILEPPSLGPFPDAVTVFVKPLSQWLTTCSPVNRLAFGATLSQPADTREAGYSQLAKYLSSYVKIDPAGSSDFLYQINRPRASTVGIPRLRINRLSKWNVTLIGRFRVTPQGPAALPSAGLSSCRLELDINTVPNEAAVELPRDTLPRLLHELVTLGQAIAERGDIP